MNVSDLIDPSFSYRLIATLMHFLWQGCLVALLAVLGDGLLSRASASRRYADALVRMAELSSSLRRLGTSAPRHFTGGVGSQLLGVQTASSQGAVGPDQLATSAKPNRVVGHRGSDYRRDGFRIATSPECLRGDSAAEC